MATKDQPPAPRAGGLSPGLGFWPVPGVALGSASVCHGLWARAPWAWRGPRLGQRVPWAGPWPWAGWGVFWWVGMGAVGWGGGQAAYKTTTKQLQNNYKTTYKTTTKQPIGSDTGPHFNKTKHIFL